MTEYTLEETICIHYQTNKLDRCNDCTGRTNSCGLYENILKIDIFKEIYQNGKKS